MSEPPPDVAPSGSLKVRRWVEEPGRLRSWERSSVNELRLWRRGTNSMLEKDCGCETGYGDQLKYQVIGDRPPRNML